MDEVALELNDKGQGTFHIMDGKEQMAEMSVGIAEGTLTVYHTEVSPRAQGMGYAKRLLGAMVDHARANHLKVVPLCPYVYSQFKRHPEEFADLWKGGQGTAAQ